MLPADEPAERLDVRRVLFRRNFLACGEQPANLFVEGTVDPDNVAEPPSPRKKAGERIYCRDAPDIPGVCLPPALFASALQVLPPGSVALEFLSMMPIPATSGIRTARV